MTDSKRLTYLIIGLGAGVAVLSAVYLPVEAWDEARRGANAYEMILRADYLNYYYLGEPDTFNTKPPLFLWAVAASFQALGVNTFALRLPSLLSLLAFLLYFRHWLSARFSPDTVLLTIGATVATNGLIGYHVGISGDTDMLFVSLLSVGCLAYYAFLRTPDTRHLYTAILALGLAFLTKGVATALVVPGMVLFTLSSRAGRRAVWSRRFGTGLLLGVMLLTGIGLLLSTMGRDTFSEGDGNLWQAMFVRDGLQRLTDPTFEPVDQPWFVFQALDIRFGPLVYVLYAVVPWAIWKFGIRPLVQRRLGDPFVWYSVCVSGSVLLLLQLSSNKHHWYVAPAIPYLAYLFARAVRLVVESERAYRWLAVGLVGLSLFSRMEDIFRTRTPTFPAPLQERIAQAGTLYIDPHMPQNLVFLLCAGAQEKVYVGTLDNLPNEDRDTCDSIDGHLVCFQ